MFQELNMIDDLGKAYYFFAAYLKKVGECRTAKKFLAQAKRVFKKTGNTIYLNKIAEHC
jgi:hypothetical protein